MAHWQLRYDYTTQRTTQLGIAVWAAASYWGTTCMLICTAVASALTRFRSKRTDVFVFCWTLKCWCARHFLRLAQQLNFGTGVSLNLPVVRRTNSPFPLCTAKYLRTCGRKGKSHGLLLEAGKSRVGRMAGWWGGWMQGSLVRHLWKSAGVEIGLLLVRRAEHADVNCQQFGRIAAVLQRQQHRLDMVMLRVASSKHK
jgi:hypothetical protein